MTQKDKELLIKDLCGRLPYGVKMLFNNEHKFMLDQINPRQYSGKNGYGVIFDFDGKVYSIEDCKPYLRPISSMTEDEKEEYKDTFASIYDINDEGEYADSWHEEWSVESYDWANEHHFDYRGLIDKGLAIEAPNEMYKRL